MVNAKGKDHSNLQNSHNVKLDNKESAREGIPYRSSFHGICELMHMSHNSFKVIVMMPVGHNDRKLWARSCRTLALHLVVKGLKRILHDSSINARCQQEVSQAHQFAYHQVFHWRCYQNDA